MLEDALLVEPGEALVHYNLACYWSLAGDKSKSLSYLSGALDIDSSYRDLIDYCGGLNEKASRVVAGGPMMGFKLGSLDGEVVTASPEFADCSDAATTHHVGVSQVAQAAINAFNAQDYTKEN